MHANNTCSQLFSKFNKQITKQFKKFNKSYTEKEIQDDNEKMHIKFQSL